jgi:hypothetical protein
MRKRVSNTDISITKKLREKNLVPNHQLEILQASLCFGTSAWPTVLFWRIPSGEFCYSSTK